LAWAVVIPEQPKTLARIDDAALGEIYVMNHPRTHEAGYDLFVPAAGMPAVANQLLAAAREAGGRLCGWQALETARVEAGIPRFGADMDETNLAPEALGPEAISYSKGCYIGQEVISRVRAYGQPAKSLRGLRLPDTMPALPNKGDKLFRFAGRGELPRPDPALPTKGDKVFRAGKEVGYITSAVASPRLGGNLALGYVRREANQPGADLLLQVPSGQFPVKIVDLPFAAREPGAP
jgi:folate-binding protein YgfZ